MKTLTLWPVASLVELSHRLAAADADLLVNQVEDQTYTVMIHGDLTGLACISAEEFAYHQPT